MINLFKKFKTFLKKPGQYFRYKKKFLRGLYFQFSKFLHFKTFYSRVYKNNFVSHLADSSDFIEIDEGYKFIKRSKIKEKVENMNQILVKIDSDLKKVDLEKFTSSDEGIIKLKSSKDFDCDSPEFKFVTSKYLIEIVSNYLKCIPILTSLSLWCSPNNRFIENSSQEYHLDHEDYRQIKGFLYLNEIDLQSGPVNIINASESNRIQNLMDYRMTESHKRVNDKIIQDLKKEININEKIMTGNTGDLLLCDTSSCFHFGSRLGTKPRFILAFQYITPFGFSMDWNWMNSDKLPFKDFKGETDSLIGKVFGNKI